MTVANGLIGILAILGILTFIRMFGRVFFAPPTHENSNLYHPRERWTMEESAPERITGVAITYEGKTYSLPRPHRHNHVIRMMVDEHGIQKPGSRGQGFITSAGRFVDRVEALSIARAANQILLGRGLHGQLFSEDLW